MAGSLVPSLPQRVLAAELEAPPVGGRAQPRAGRRRAGVVGDEAVADRGSAGQGVRRRRPRAGQAVRPGRRRTPRRWSSWPARHAAAPAGGRASSTPCPRASPRTWSWSPPPAAIRSYEAQFVPGLWQTEDYARAVLSANCVTRHPRARSSSGSGSGCAASRSVGPARSPAPGHVGHPGRGRHPPPGRRPGRHAPPARSGCARPPPGRTDTAGPAVLRRRPHQPPRAVHLVRPAATRTGPSPPAPAAPWARWSKTTRPSSPAIPLSSITCAPTP